MNNSTVLSYTDFVQRVRRFPRHEVVAAVTNASIQLTNSQTGKPSTIDPSGPIQPFALAAIAKAAIVSGNDFRNKPVTHSSLEWLCHSLISVEEPIIVGGGLDSFLVRTAFDQFPYQVSISEDLSRTLAMLEWTASDTEQTVITPAFWLRVLGCSLKEFVGLAILLYIGALENGGIFDPKWVYQPNFKLIVRQLDKDVIERVSARHFMTNVDEFRTIAKSHQLDDRCLRRFEFNPLAEKPFVELPNSLPMAPIVSFVLSKATPKSLYYLGAADSGPQFTNALGQVFENYIGNQIGLASPLLLLHDLEYEPNHRSADYIAVFENAVIIVEVKATRLTADGRLGGLQLDGELERTLGKGRQQILDTAKLIRTRHRAFADVPVDRPQIGIVVTMEPYFQANSNSMLQKSVSDTPVFFASARELENLVSLDQETVADALLRILADETRRSWNLANSLGIGHGKTNKILAKAWGAFPFGSDGHTSPQSDPES